MDDLIAALTIFRKYGNEQSPTGCEHDTLYVAGVHPSKMDPADIQRLVDFGFGHPDLDENDELEDKYENDEYENEDEPWYSFRFGSF